LLFDSNARHWIGSTNPWNGAMDADFSEGTKSSEPKYLAVNRLIHAMSRMQFGNPSGPEAGR
jgi:hypothetical protein